MYQYKKILNRQVDLGPSMLDVKYKQLGCTGLVTTPLNMAPNLSECNVSHAGIALHVIGDCNAKVGNEETKGGVLHVIGDCNAKVGNVETTGTTGRFGLGERNEEIGLLNSVD